MERNKKTREKERAYHEAADLALKALADFSGRARMHAMAMVEQSEAELNAQHNRTGLDIIRVTDSFTNSAADVNTRFITEAQALIDTLDHPDDRQAAETELRDRTAMVDSRVRDSIAIVDSRAQGTRGDLDVRLRNYEDAVRARLASFQDRTTRQTSVQSLISLLEEGATSLEALIDERSMQFVVLCDDRLKRLEDLAQVKGEQLTVMAEQQLHLLRATVERLKSRRVTAQERSQRSRNTGSSSGSTGNNRGTHSQQHQTTSSSERQRDPRIDRLIGKATGVDRKPYAIVVANIDHHRQQGKTDSEIYRLLIRSFHPDVSEHEHTDSVIRVITLAYNKKDKQFRI